MKISDQQFVAGMVEAVNKEGYFHTGRPQYWSAEKKRGECLIGYAVEEAHAGACPRYGGDLAFGLLVGLGVSAPYARLGRMAQSFQDGGTVWGAVLRGFLYGVRLVERGVESERAAMRARLWMLGNVGALRDNRPIEDEYTIILEAQDTLDQAVAKMKDDLAAFSEALTKASKTCEGVLTQMAADGTKVNIEVPSLTALGIDPPHTKESFATVA